MLKLIMKKDVYHLPNEHGNLISSLTYIDQFNFPKSHKIVDLGCGYGSLVYNLYQKGYKKIEGFEVDKNG